MRKKIKLITVLLVFSLLPLTLFTACDKDTNCYLDVSVIDMTTKKPIKDVQIDVKQDGGMVKAHGKTDKTGHYTTQFSAPAIVLIKADLSVANNGHRRAEMSVRLQDGETVEAEILLPQTVTY